jgi:hypothetical protein
MNKDHTMSLPPELASFAAAAPELSAARALSYDKKAGLDLIAHLSAAKLRSHLEALGEVSPDKEVKKAARAAAYKLKSAGIDGGVKLDGGIDLAVKVETVDIAAATVPGMDGRLQLVLPNLPGHGGGELDLREGDKPRAEVVSELAIGRIRRFAADNGLGKALQPLQLIDLDMAARLIDIAEEASALSGLMVPPTFSHFRSWRQRAATFGADPSRASARAKLGAVPNGLPDGAIDELGQNPRLGYLSAPVTAFTKIDKDFRALMHGREPMERGDFDAQAKALLEQAVADWWASDNQKKAACLWLEASADLLLAADDEASARMALAVSDDLASWRGEALAHPLIKKAFMGAVDLEGAWNHREAHVHGHAHHD